MLKKYAVFSLVVLSAIVYVQAEAAAAYRQATYIYQEKQRNDPFQPFLADNTNTLLDMPVEPSGQRGGLSLEPGQLKLTAVIFTPADRKAVAEDMTGKGYFLSEGLPIGKYGTVQKIETGQVVIGESWRTTSGRLVSKETVMRLKTEGE